MTKINTNTDVDTTDNKEVEPTIKVEDGEEVKLKVENGEELKIKEEYNDIFTSLVGIILVFILLFSGMDYINKYENCAIMYDKLDPMVSNVECILDYKFIEKGILPGDRNEYYSINLEEYFDSDELQLLQDIKEKSNNGIIVSAIDKRKAKLIIINKLKEIEKDVSEIDKKIDNKLN